jgi:hypothetical protein
MGGHENKYKGENCMNMEQQQQPNIINRVGNWINERYENTRAFVGRVALVGGMTVGGGVALHETFESAPAAVPAAEAAGVPCGEMDDCTGNVVVDPQTGSTYEKNVTLVKGTLPNTTTTTPETTTTHPNTTTSTTVPKTTTTTSTTIPRTTTTTTPEASTTTTTPEATTTTTEPKKPTTTTSTTMPPTTVPGTQPPKEVKPPTD